jgi:outer membrane protein OmpA-like peptidoglycan-associated protein
VNVVTDMLNRTPGIDLQTTYSPEQVTVSGVYTNPDARATIEQTLEALPGIPPVDYGQLIPQALQGRIYFATASAQIDSGEQTRKLLAIVEFLQASPETTLQIIGHTDHRGEVDKNQQLARDRAIAVQDFLVAQGIAASQLAVEGEIDYPPGIREQDPLWLSRCVRFEIADMP